MQRRPVRPVDSSPADHRVSIHVKRLLTYINLPTKQGATLSLTFSDSRVGPHRQLRAARVLEAVGAPGSALGPGLPALGRARAASRYLRGLPAMRINRIVEKGAASRGGVPGDRTCGGAQLEPPHGGIAAEIETKSRPITQRVYLAGRIVPWMCHCLRSHRSGVCRRNRHRRA